MHFPILPLKLMPRHLEADALRLYDMQRFDPLPLLEITRLSKEVWQKVERLAWWGNSLAPRRLQRIICQGGHLCRAAGQDRKPIWANLVMGWKVDVQNLPAGSVHNRHEILRTLKMSVVLLGQIAGDSGQRTRGCA
jgi:hypothetical protein